MAKRKVSLTYVYSKDSEDAKYLQFLIDKVRDFDAIDFIPICLEEHKSAKSKIKKLQQEIQDLTKGQTRSDAKAYMKAGTLNQELGRYEVALKYSELSPALIIERGTEDEVTLMGTRNSLSQLLDLFTKVSDVATFFGSFELSRFDSLIREVGRVAVKAMQNKSAGEGLETTQ